MGAFRGCGAEPEGSQGGRTLARRLPPPGSLSHRGQPVGVRARCRAAGAARERDALQDLADDLHKTLLSRDVIGQAKGILMERHKFTPQGAFDALRLASSRLNEQRHAVALDL